MGLRNKMKGMIPEPLSHLIPNRFEVIGDVAIISIPPELNDFKVEIAENIILNRKNVKTVVNKVAMLKGEKRVGKFEILSGGDTKTLYKEYNFRYKLDVKEVFFNSRLSFERSRIASLVRSFEHVLIPFCGVGPFVVPVAAKSSSVIAVEKNAQACKWLSENIRLNRVDGNVSIILGDASDIASTIDVSFNRVIVPTPYGKDHYLETFSPLVKKGGMIHFYTFKKPHQIPYLLEIYQNRGFQVVFYRRCGNVAPSVSRWVFDLKKQ